MKPTDEQVALLLNALNELLDDDEADVPTSTGDRISEAVSAFPFHVCDVCGQLAADGTLHCPGSFLGEPMMDVSEA